MVMTTDGLNVIRDWFASELNNAPTHVGIGEGGRVIDNFNSYADDTALQTAWPTNESTVTRDTTTPKEGAVTCIWTTNATPASDPYMEHTLADEDWSEFNRIEFWFQTPDASKSHFIEITNNGSVQTAYDFKDQLLDNTWIKVIIYFVDTGWDYDDVELIKFRVDDAEFTSSTIFYVDDIEVFAANPKASDTIIPEELTRLAFESVSTDTSQEVTFTAFLPSTDAPTLNHTLRRMGITNSAGVGNPTVFTVRKHADIFKTNAIDVSYTIQFRIQEVE